MWDQVHRRGKHYLLIGREPYIPIRQTEQSVVKLVCKEQPHNLFKTRQAVFDSLTGCISKLYLIINDHRTCETLNTTDIATSPVTLTHLPGARLNSETNHT